MWSGVPLATCGFLSGSVVSPYGPSQPCLRARGTCLCTPPAAVSPEETDSETSSCPAALWRVFLCRPQPRLFSIRSDNCVVHPHLPCNDEGQGIRKAVRASVKLTP